MPGLKLKRPVRPPAMISIVSMIDVMMILLFFFMVTSTYLDLDMVPALQSTDDPAPATAAAASPSPTLLIRITSDGGTVVAGQLLASDALSGLLRARLMADPLATVLLLPSGGATLQALISAMDRITAAGVLRLKVIRLQAQPGGAMP